MAFTQDFRTQRRNYEDGDTRIGEKDRLWYDSVTNTIRISDGETPGGIAVSGGSGGGSSYTLPTATTTVKGGVKVDGTTIAINNQVISVGTVPYSSISSAPSIPTKVSDLTNDTGFITGVSWNSVTGKPTLFSGAYADLTGKPTAVSAFTNDSGYLTSSSLSSYATQSYVTSRGYITSTSLPTKVSDLTNDSHFLTESNFDLNTINYDSNNKLHATGILPGDEDGFTAVYAGRASSIATLPNTVIQSQAQVNGYAQNNFQNTDDGTQSSTEWVATSPNGDDSNYYIDLGINGASWDGSAENSLYNNVGARDGWLYVQGGNAGGGNLVLGTSLANTYTKIISGDASAGDTEVARFSSTEIKLSTQLTFSDNTTQTTAWAGAVSYNDLTDTPSLFSGSYTDLTDKPSLVTSYNQLTDRPTLFSGSYTDLTNRPTLVTSYNDLTDRPTLVTSYNDLTDRPTLVTSYNDLTDLPSLFSGSYNDLTDVPSAPIIALGDLTDVDLTTAPTAGQVLKFDGTKWAPGVDATTGGDGTDADTLEGQHGTYYLDYNNFTNTPTIPTIVTVNGTAITLGSSGTVTAAAGTLTGTTLNSNIVHSSLTSVGTLSGLTVNGLTALNGYVVAGTVAKTGGTIGQNQVATVTTTPSNNGLWGTPGQFGPTDITIGSVTVTCTINVDEGGNLTLTVVSSTTGAVSVGSTGTLTGTFSNIWGSNEFDNVTVTVATISGPTAIDLTKSVNELSDGAFSLADGTEGQVLYLTTKSTVTSASAIVVTVANYRTTGSASTNYSLYPFTNNGGMCSLLFNNGSWQTTNTASAVTPTALTIGTGLKGTASTFDGSTANTIKLDTTFGSLTAVNATTTTLSAGSLYHNYTVSALASGTYTIAMPAVSTLTVGQQIVFFIPSAAGSYKFTLNNGTTSIIAGNIQSYARAITFTVLSTGSEVAASWDYKMSYQLTVSGTGSSLASISGANFTSLYASTIDTGGGGTLSISQSSGTINLGQTGTNISQTLNILSYALGATYTKTINLGTNLNGGTSTINIGTGVTSGTANLNIGSTSSTVQMNGAVTITSLTATNSIVGSVTGNAATATKLGTARAINGVNFDGSAAITVTANTTNALTIGTGLSGTSFNGNTAVTIAVDSTVALRADTHYIGTTSIALNRASGSQTLTGVSIDGNAGTVTDGVYTTGSYANPSWITSLDYSKLTSTPTLFSGSYTDLTSKPTIYSSAYVGTTSLDFTRSSASQTLTGVSIDGNAATVTNGVYTTGSYANPAWITSLAYSKLTGTPTVPTNVSQLTNDSGFATLTGIETFTNKTLTLPTIGGTGATFNGSSSGTTVLKASSTAGTTTITLPATTGTVVTTGDTGTVTNAMLAGSIANAKLVNSKVTIGTTDISLGTTASNLDGLNLVTSTSFSGALLGNASTATKLATARNINGTAFDGSAAITITANTTNALTIGTGLSGTSFNGSGAVTIAIDSTVATLTGSQTLTNKTLTLPTIGGTGATFNGSTSGTTVVKATAAAGSTTLTLPAATDTLVGKATTDTLTNKSISGSTNTLTNIPNSALTNSSVTVNGSAISLGGSATITVNSISASGFSTSLGFDSGGNLILSNGTYFRAPNGISIQTGGPSFKNWAFDTSGNITFPDSTVQSTAWVGTAPAGTLTGTTLNSTVVNSSLTSVGTLTGLTVTSTNTSNSNVASITGVVSAGHGGTATWQFQTEGSSLGSYGSRIAFPDSTYQYTAWTGSAPTLTTPRNINGVAFDGSAAITIKASTTNALTIGSGLTGTSFDGGSAVTIAVDTSTVALKSNITYIGTTSIALNRASANLALTGILSIDGNAATATKLAATKNINGVAFDGSADITVTAAAGTLTGTTLNSTVTASSLQSVGQLTNLQISGGATVVNNSSTTSYINLGSIGQLFDDGNLHIHAKTGNMWINTLDSSPIYIGTQYNSGSGSSIISNTPYRVRTPWHSAIDTEITLDNYRYRISNSGGIFPQIISNISGTTVNTSWVAVATLNGTSITQTGNTGALIPNNSWTSLYTNHGMDISSDMVVVTVTDKAHGVVHRVTFIREDNGSTTGYSIFAEKLW